MGRNAEGQAIKDNQSKDNKDSKHHRTSLTKNSAATRSKTKGLTMNQNAGLSPSKSAGSTTPHPSVPAASPPKPTNDVKAVTPDNRKLDADGENSIKSFTSLIWVKEATLL